MSKKTFNINSDLYEESNIAKAISEFQGYNIAFSNSTITIDDEDPQFIFNELMNYVHFISLENPLGV